jgi:hypothetical protein
MVWYGNGEMGLVPGYVLYFEWLITWTGILEKTTVHRDRIEDTKST